MLEMANVKTAYVDDIDQQFQNQQLMSYTLYQ